MIPPVLSTAGTSGYEKLYHNAISELVTTMQNNTRTTPPGRYNQEYRVELRTWLAALSDVIKGSASVAHACHAIHKQQQSETRHPHQFPLCPKLTELRPDAGKFTILARLATTRSEGNPRYTRPEISTIRKAESKKSENNKNCKNLRICRTACGCCRRRRCCHCS